MISKIGVILNVPEPYGGALKDLVEECPFLEVTEKGGSYTLNLSDHKSIEVWDASGTLHLDLPFPFKARSLLDFFTSLQNLQTISLGGLIYCPKRTLLSQGPDGPSERLTEKEDILFQALIEGGEMGVEIGRLKDKIWGENYHTDPHALETLIHRLRSKIQGFGSLELLSVGPKTYALRTRLQKQS